MLCSFIDHTVAKLLYKCMAAVIYAQTNACAPCKLDKCIVLANTTKQKLLLHPALLHHCSCMRTSQPVCTQHAHIRPQAPKTTTVRPESVAARALSICCGHEGWWRDMHARTSHVSSALIRPTSAYIGAPKGRPSTVDHSLI